MSRLLLNEKKGSSARHIFTSIIRIHFHSIKITDFSFHGTLETLDLYSAIPL